MAAVYVKIVVEVEGDDVAAVEVARLDSKSVSFSQNLQLKLFQVLLVGNSNGVLTISEYDKSNEMGDTVVAYIERLEG